MREYLLILIVVLPVALGNGQGGAAVVYDPKADANATEANVVAKKNLLQSLKEFKLFEEIKNAQNKLNDAMEKVEFLQKLKSVKQTYDLLAGIVCSTRRLAINLQFDQRINGYCFFQFRYDLAVVKFQLANDLLGKVVNVGLAMSQGERLGLLNESVDKLAEAQEELEDLNQLIEKNIEADYERAVDFFELMQQNQMRWSTNTYNLFNDA